MQDDDFLSDLALTVLALLNMLGKFCAGAALVCVLGYTTIATMFGLDGFLQTPLWQWQLRGLAVFVFGLVVALGTAWFGRMLRPQDEASSPTAEP